MSIRELTWVGSSLEDLKLFPDEVKSEIGYALYLAQVGKKHINAKPLQGFGGAKVQEIVSDCDGGTYRGVYTVQFKRSVYVLHCFQKKSTKGIATPKREIDLIQARLRTAINDYKNKDSK